MRWTRVLCMTAQKIKIVKNQNNLFLEKGVKMVNVDFDSRVKKSQIRTDELQKTCDKIVMIRVILAMCEIFFLYKFIDTEQNLYGGLFWATILVFIGVLLWHGRVKSRLKKESLYRKINLEYTQRMTDEWKKFGDGGQDFATEGHPYALDLDVVGNVSLYKKISVANTFLGRKKLAEYLVGQKSAESERLERQKAVSELANNVDFVLAGSAS